MGNRWTDDQKKVIEARGCNLLVSAAAGSGKTAVLVERIIQLIEEGSDIDRMLVVTFTKAAAGEMRERIMDGLSARLENLWEEVHVDEVDRLKRADFMRHQLLKLGNASIMTIHAFCSDVINNYFYLIDLNPDFKVGDEAETEALRREMLDETMEAAYEASAEDFTALAEGFGGDRSDERLRQMVLKLYDFMMSKPDPFVWLDEAVAQQEKAGSSLEAFEGSDWVKEIIGHAQLELEESALLIKESLKICDETWGPAPYRAALEDDWVQIEGLQAAASKGFDALLEALKTVSYSRLKSFKPETPHGGVLQEQVKGNREMMKDLLKGLSNSFYKKDGAYFRRQLHWTAMVTKALVHLVKDFSQRYDDIKREKAIFDFGDLEHKAIALIGLEPVREALKERYSHLFVDEYQDTNEVQEYILSSIARDNNRFMVGDVKQSIYKFRLADPTIFTRKYKTFKKEAGAIDRKIDLSKNFRSRAEVLQAVNGVFGKIMSEDLGDVTYDEDCALYPGRDFPEHPQPPVELNVFYKAGSDLELSDEWAEMATTEIEARLIAKRIKEILKESVYDGKLQAYRTPTYRDIVLLMRATSSRKKIYEEVFEEQGIPMYVDGGDGYFQAIEIKMMMSLLRLIDNAHQDIHLMTVMHSPMGEFSMEEILELRHRRTSLRKGKGRVSFYDDLMACLEDEDGTSDFTQNGNGDDLSKLLLKSRAFVEQLRLWQEEVQHRSLDSFIWSIMMDTGYYHYVSAMPGGQEREANLRLLVERAAQYEKLSKAGLFNFIRYAENMERNAGDLDTAKIIGENDDVVRLMSIHKSKGLEFPIVIMCNAGGRFNTRDLSEPMMLHKDLGLGLRYVDLEKRTTIDSLPQIAMKLKARRELLSEEMRILYVAMTRAVDRLLIYGTVAKKEKAQEKWMRGCLRPNLLKASSMLDWLGMASEEVLTINWLGEGDLNQLDRLETENGEPNHGSEPGDQNNQSKSDLAVALGDEAKIEKNEKTGALRGVTSSAYTQFEVARRLSYQYPHASAAQKPFKVSVTALMGKSGSQVSVPTLALRPQWMESEKGMDATTAGTLYHKILQVMPTEDVALDLLQDEHYIEGEMKRMAEQGILPEAAEKLLKGSVVAQFFKTDLARRMLKSPKVEREKAFVVRQMLEGDPVLVQGIIDGFFEEDGELVVFDYKTGGWGFKSHEEAVDAYEGQVKAYCKALETIGHKRVKEGWVVLLERGWNLKVVG